MADPITQVVQSLGLVTAYGYAKSKGYTGTEEEFAEAAAAIGQGAATATAAAEAASEDADTATTAAGTATTAAGNAENSATAALQYMNNAETAATNAGTAQTAAAGSATAAAASAQAAATSEYNAGVAAGASSDYALVSQDHSEDSEAWAVGTKNGTDVPATAEQYHNNAKYYAEQAEASKRAVASSETAAETAAAAAQEWATGEGTDVPGGGSVPGTENNAEYFAQQAAASAASGIAALANETAMLNSGYYLSEIQITDSDIVVGENINTDTGIRNTNTKRSRTTLQDKNGKVLSFFSTNYQIQVLSYGINGNIATGTDYTGKLTATWINNAIINFPDNTKKYCLIFRRIDDATMTETDKAELISALSIYEYTDTSLEMSGVPADAEAVGDIFKNITERTKNQININALSSAGVTVSAGEAVGTANAFSSNFLNGLPAGEFEENTQYTLSYIAYNEGATVSGNGIRFIIKYTDETHNIKNTPNNTSEWTKFTYTTAQGKTVDYIGISYNSGPNNIWHIKELQIEKGDKATEYVPYFSAIDYVARANNNELNNDAVKYPLSKFYHVYDDISLVPTYEGVIEKYDELVSLYPDYITKRAISSGSFTNYEYILTFGNYNAKETRRAKDAVINKPVILICSGVHGYERSSVMGLYSFVKSLCESDFTLRKIIGNCAIKFIPIVCPWGYNNNSRLNENGVNINRNFASNDWVLTPTGDNYSGASAGDQPETQVVQSWIDENTNAVLLIDWHNSQYVEEISCLLSDNTEILSELKKKYLYAIDGIIPYWQKVRGLSNGNVYGYTATSTATGTTKSYAIGKGIVAGTLETSWNIGNSGKDSVVTISTNAEVIGSILRELESYYKIT